MSNDATDLGVMLPERVLAEALQTTIDSLFPAMQQPEALGLDTILPVIGLFCGCTNGVTANGVDATHVRVVFDNPLNGETGHQRDVIEHARAYRIVPPGSNRPITVVSVVAELDDDDNVASVLLTTSEHVSVPNYEARVYFLESA